MGLSEHDCNATLSKRERHTLKERISRTSRIFFFPDNIKKYERIEKVISRIRELENYTFRTRLQRHTLTTG